MITLGAGLARAAIYNTNTNGFPSTLIADGGDVDVSTTGEKEAVISAALQPGMYWIIVVSNVAVTLGAGTTSSLAHGGTGSSSFIRNWTASMTYGAFSSDLSAQTWTPVTSGVSVAPWLRAV